MPLRQLEAYIGDLHIISEVRVGLLLPREPFACPHSLLRWLLHAYIIIRIRWMRSRVSRSRLTVDSHIERLLAEQRKLKLAGSGLQRVVREEVHQMDRSQLAEAFAVLRRCRIRPWREATAGPMERPWPGRVRPPWRVELILSFRTWRFWSTP